MPNVKFQMKHSVLTTCRPHGWYHTSPKSWSRHPSSPNPSSPPSSSSSPSSSSPSPFPSPSSSASPSPSSSVSSPPPPSPSSSSAAVFVSPPPNPSPTRSLTSRWTPSTMTPTRIPRTNQSSRCGSVVGAGAVAPSPSFAASAARLIPHRSSQSPLPPPLAASTCRGGLGPGFPSSARPCRLLPTCCRCAPPPPRRLDHHGASRSGPSPWRRVTRVSRLAEARREAARARQIGSRENREWWRPGDSAGGQREDEVACAFRPCWRTPISPCPPTGGSCLSNSGDPTIRSLLPRHTSPTFATRLLAFKPTSPPDPTRRRRHRRRLPPAADPARRGRRFLLSSALASYKSASGARRLTSTRGSDRWRPWLLLLLPRWCRGFGTERRTSRRPSASQLSPMTTRR